MEEINFPRGGSLPSSDVLITPFDMKKMHKLAERDVQESRSKGKRQKRSLRSKEVDFEDDGGLENSNSASVTVDFLTFNKLTVGSIFLARVKEIHDTELVLALPNGLIGYVSISEVSNLFSHSLKAIADEEDDDEEVDLPHLKEFFHLGQLVMSVIVKLEVSTTSGAKTTKRIECSVKPATVNSYRPFLNKSSCYLEGLVLWGEVSSVEDKGYFIDIGIEVVSKSKGDLKFFIPSTSNVLLKEGDLLFTTVVGKDSRIVKLSPENCAIPPLIISSYDEVSPGLVLQATVCDLTQNGAILELGNGIRGTINLFQFEQQILPTENKCSFPLAKGASVEARVIYVDYSTRKIGLSLKTFSLSNRLPFEFQSDLPVGKIVDAKVVRIDSSLGILFQLENNSFAYCISNRLSDDPSVDLDSFDIGGVHKARVVDYSLMDELFIISLQPSVLAQPFIRYEDVPVGSVVRGTIQKILPAGAVVSLADSIRAFCPVLWSTDAQVISGKNPLAKYEPGKQIKFTIVDVIPEDKRITVSCKKSLLSPPYPILTCMEEAIPGTVTMGVVASIKEYGCFVNFFSNINGLVPMRELSWSFVNSPHDVVYVGKTVKCKVLERNEKQLLLTLKVDRPSHIPAATTNSNSMIGTAAVAKVVKVVPSRGLLVSFSANQNCSLSGIIHLTDLYDEPHSNPLESFYPGLTLNAIVVDVQDRNGKADYFLSLRSCHRENPTQIKSLISVPKLNDTVTGNVVTINDGGVFVSLTRNLDGRVKIKELSIDYIQDWKSIYKLGDLVTCKVIDISEEGMYELSIRAIQEEQADSLGLKYSWTNLVEDAKYECIVTNVHPYGIFLRILGSKPPITGLCHSSQIHSNTNGELGGEHQYQRGDQVTATILSIDLEKKRIQFCIPPKDGEETNQVYHDEILPERPTSHSTPTQTEASLEETGFDWKCTDDPVVQSPANTINEIEESTDSESSDPESSSPLNPKGKKKNRISKKQRLLHEEMITKQESFLTESLASGPRNEQDFQRACTSTPHDPLIYVQFMNWYLKRNALDQARIVARTALKRIPLHLEQPRQVIWLALLSAENLYGGEESLERMLQEARQCTDEKSLLIAFARVLFTTGGKDGNRRAESVYSLLVKRFNKSCKCWMLRSLFYFLTNNPAVGREVQQQAMLQLPSHKHPKAIVQWALMERKHGSMEKSRTHFESLLGQHPKRFDIWIVYWQSETDPSAKYSLLERVASMKWSVRKSKLVFKTWLECAKQLPVASGREESIQRVKVAAKRYVESLQ